MKLVKINRVWVNPEKVIMVQEVRINPHSKEDFSTWVEITLEGNYPREHPADYTSVIDEPNIIHTYLPLDEVVAIINGELDNA